MTRKKPENNEPSIRNMELYAAVVDRVGTYTEIGEMYGVTKQRVQQIAVEVERWMRPQFAGVVADIKLKQTEILLHLFQEAMTQWERSKLDARKRSTTTAGKFPGTTKVRMGRLGDPAFLDQARGALADIRKIWGADAPVKHADTNPTGDGPAVLEIVIKDRTELAGAKSLPELQRLLHGSN